MRKYKTYKGPDQNKDKKFFCVSYITWIIIQIFSNKRITICLQLNRWRNRQKNVRWFGAVRTSKPRMYNSIWLHAFGLMNYHSISYIIKFSIPYNINNIAFNVNYSFSYKIIVPNDYNPSLPNICFIQYLSLYPFCWLFMNYICASGNFKSSLEKFNQKINCIINCFLSLKFFFSRL